MKRAALLLIFLLMHSAAAATPKKAVFALVLGVNQSFDRSLPTLRYADDDAAQYLELFRALGAHTYLLSRLDENSGRVHPQANAEAHEPRRHELDRAVAALAADVAQARERHIETVFYFVYSGHGNVRQGEGYLALEDARLDAQTIEHEIIDRVHADQSHLIVDACYSYFLAYGRGPGGERRSLHGFAGLTGLAARSQIGLLLSTSSARESHEWESFQAGVFSHEVRSGLYGAADSDGDGQISYREIAAFIERANASIPNEKFRPDVYARPPQSSTQLLDLHGGLDRRIELDGSQQGHYLLEDSRGVRIAELHNGQPVTLLRPTGTGPIYLRSADDQQEFVIAPMEDVVALRNLSPQLGRSRSRGAAHDAFSSIFALPFDRQVEADYAFRALPAPFAETPIERRARRRHSFGYGLFGLGGASLIAGLSLSFTARALRETPPGTAQAELAVRNQEISARNIGAGALYGLTAASTLAATLLLVIPERSPGGISVSLAPMGAGASCRVSF